MTFKDHSTAVCLASPQEMMLWLIQTKCDKKKCVTIWLQPAGLTQWYLFSLQRYLLVSPPADGGQGRRRAITIFQSHFGLSLSQLQLACSSLRQLFLPFTLSFLGPLSGLYYAWAAQGEGGCSHVHPPSHKTLHIWATEAEARLLLTGAFSELIEMPGYFGIDS